jgi:hypothetical protein
MDKFFAVVEKSFHKSVVVGEWSVTMGVLGFICSVCGVKQSLPLFAVALTGLL